MRYCVFLIMMFLGAVLWAQDNDSRLHVKSLELVDNDTEASRAQKKDLNGDKCALIKIHTPNMDDADRRKLEFAADLGTFLYPEQATGEVKLFLTERCKTLIIKHPDYGVLTYKMTVSVEGYKTYKMVLEADKSFIAPSVTFNSNYVNVKVTPSDATITVDGRYCSNGKINISTGEPHRLVVTHALYHEYQRDIYSSADEKLEYVVRLEPAFGWLDIKSVPENGATILINGKKVGVTPYHTDTLASGEYDVTVLKDLFETTTKTVVVLDNVTGDVTIPMAPMYAEVSINTDDGAEIFVDGEALGMGRWKGRLNEGVHVFEARKTSHRTTNKTVEIKIGRYENITIDNPIPIYGAVDIQSQPDEADVYLDGKKIGETPIKKNNILIGDHLLRIEKENYYSASKTITVKEGEVLSVNETLTKKKVSEPKYEPKNETTTKSYSSTNSTKGTKYGSNRSYSGSNTFLIFNAAYLNSPQWSFGATIGTVNRFGLFASVMTNLNFRINADLECDSDGLVNGYYPVYVKSSNSRFSLIGGVLVRFADNVTCLSFGLGYGFRGKFWETQDGNIVKSANESFKGLEYLVGLQFHIGGFVMAFDFVPTMLKTVEIRFGMGFKW